MIVVTGGTGNVGGAVVRTLLARGEPVTAVARRVTAVPAAATAHAADLDDVAGLRPALVGAKALLLMVAGNRPREIVSAAAAAGVARVVLLSSLGAGTRPEAYAHARAFEDAVRSGSADWTILRAGGFASNALAWRARIREAGQVAAPFGDVALPFVDPEDIAAVAAQVLTTDGHAGRTYVLTGPRATTPRERAADVGAALGRELRFVEQTREEAAAEMLQGLPAAIVEATLAVLGRPTPAEQVVSPDVERLLGRAPTSFAEWAARTAAAFR